MIDKVGLLNDIFSEQKRLMDAMDEGTREVPAVVDYRKLSGIEKYAGRHLHDIDGTCIKNQWWREDGFCGILNAGE